MYATLRTAVVATTLVLSLGTAAGCAGENPAATATPSDASFDGGVTFGSGGRANMLGRGSTAAVDSGVVDSGVTVTTSGGVTFGSGG